MKFYLYIGALYITLSPDVCINKEKKNEMTSGILIDNFSIILKQYPYGHLQFFLLYLSIFPVVSEYKQ